MFLKILCFIQLSFLITCKNLWEIIGDSLDGTPLFSLFLTSVMSIWRAFIEFTFTVLINLLFVRYRQTWIFCGNSEYLTWKPQSQTHMVENQFNFSILQWQNSSPGIIL